MPSASIGSSAEVQAVRAPDRAVEPCWAWLGADGAGEVVPQRDVRPLLVRVLGAGER